MPPKKRIYSECDDPSSNLKSKKLKLAMSKYINNKNISEDTESSDNLPEILNNTNSNNALLTKSSSSSSSLSSVQLSISERLLSIEQELSKQLETISFPSKVGYVYNPIIYAFEVHKKYVIKYCNEPKKILFLGMNPGPWGMSQTGIPFGEISMVRDWLKIHGYVEKPPKEQPDRKVTGFDCKRSEISGKRLWGLFKELCVTPENFFQYSYKEEQKLIHELCDQALSKIIQLLNVEIVIGIGRFAEKRAQAVISADNLSVQVLWITHPSPRSVGNQNWDQKTKQRLHDLGLAEYFTS
ncbi:hypothetical protein M0802_010726 [Mischocyttarus mexicanus]|nr:hypothetical protein M0802_010726 [Mischocyttarus mexicanus]